MLQSFCTFPLASIWAHDAPSLNERGCEKQLLSLQFPTSQCIQKVTTACVQPFLPTSIRNLAVVPSMPSNLEGGDLLRLLSRSNYWSWFWLQADELGSFEGIGTTFSNHVALGPVTVSIWKMFFIRNIQKLWFIQLSTVSSLQEPETEANEGTDDAKNGQVILKEVPDWWMGKCLFSALPSDSKWIYEYMIYLHVPIELNEGVMTRKEKGRTHETSANKA